MPEYPPYEELQGQIDAAIQNLDAYVTQAEGGLQEALLSPSEVAHALRTTLLAVSASLGECREDVPYAPMHQVRTPDGELIWCCTHNPAHPPACD